MSPELAAIAERAFALLAAGAASRHEPFHTPTLASTGLDGRPRLRTVVLRHVDMVLRTLRFHTDRRSDKAAELAADPRFALHGYDAPAKVQIRVEGRVTLHATDALADAAWNASRAMSRVCYGSQPGPGVEIAQAGAFALPHDDEAIEAGRRHFVAVVCAVERLEWLDLALAGHRRALFDWRAGAVQARWLVP